MAGAADVRAVAVSRGVAVVSNVPYIHTRHLPTHSSGVMTHVAHEAAMAAARAVKANAAMPRAMPHARANPMRSVNTPHKM